jgi:SAM-dependent methyltransferase
VHDAQTATLPVPPAEMRALTGIVDEALYDNPTGALVAAQLESDPAAYDRVLDFGCGCGRTARQLLQQQPRPSRYTGIDLHRGMVGWCQANLAPVDPGFEFRHHDVFSACFNPAPGLPKTLPLPVGDGEYSLAIAWSVFTHLTQMQTEHYLAELARALDDTGSIVSTWFFFDKSAYPMMPDQLNAVYINEVDLSSAVLFHRPWVVALAESVGLTVTGVIPPEIRGFHWLVRLSRSRPGLQAVEFPEDTAPAGRLLAPVPTRDPSRIGLDPPAG